MQNSIIKARQMINGGNKNGIFNVCINYGGQDEIVDVVKKISKKDAGILFACSNF